jgi:LysR family transcriptional regulator, benzoate and cis,cis-muconate-responsive activator of ben and cat genes
MAVELRHLRYFVRVAENENVSRAALQLHVSQPALSRQIRDLESELGVLMLERTAKSVSLTRAGHVFLKEARAVLERADDAIRRARAVAGAELNVGYSPTPTARLLPLILRLYQRRMPKVRVRLHDSGNDENLAGLRNGQLQLAFVFLSTKASSLNGLRFEELIYENARLAIPPNHLFARRNTVSLDEAAREPFIGYTRAEYPGYHRFLKSVFAKVKTKPRIIEEHDSFSGIIAAVEAGTGVALVLDSFRLSAGNRVKLLGLTPEPKPSIVAIAAPAGSLSPQAEKFWQCAREAALASRVTPSEFVSRHLPGSITL